MTILLLGFGPEIAAPTVDGDLPFFDFFLRKLSLICDSFSIALLRRHLVNPPRAKLHVLWIFASKSLSSSPCIVSAGFAVEWNQDGDEFSSLCLDALLFSLGFFAMGDEFSSLS